MSELRKLILGLSLLDAVDGYYVLAVHDTVSVGRFDSKDATPSTTQKMLEELGWVYEQGPACWVFHL